MSSFMYDVSKFDWHVFEVFLTPLIGPGAYGKVITFPILVPHFSGKGRGKFW